MIRNKTPFRVATTLFLLLTLISIYGCSNKQEEGIPACLPLPNDFNELDLVGTWKANYFGDVDKLIIREDGTYKQIFISEYINFESDWNEWYISSEREGYIRLHLIGMRRCGGETIESECNDPNGGLPGSSEAINPCVPAFVTMNDEVVVFVTGTNRDVPRGIILKHARLAGSSWTYSFSLER